jgi:hypothetical protein
MRIPCELTPRNVDADTVTAYEPAVRAEKRKCPEESVVAVADIPVPVFFAST